MRYDQFDSCSVETSHYIGQMKGMVSHAWSSSAPLPVDVQCPASFPISSLRFPPTRLCVVVLLVPCLFGVPPTRLCVVVLLVPCLFGDSRVPQLSFLHESFQSVSIASTSRHLSKRLSTISWKVHKYVHCNKKM